MPRTDREDSRSELMEELIRCGFTSDQAYMKCIGFTSNHITASEVARIKRLVAEVRQKYESYGQRCENALKTERQAGQEFIQAIKKLVEEAESPEKRPSPVPSPRQLAEIMEKVDRL